jgi:hypothetical protein
MGCGGSEQVDGKWYMVNGKTIHHIPFTINQDTGFLPKRLSHDYAQSLSRS